MGHLLHHRYRRFPISRPSSAPPPRSPAGNRSASSWRLSCAARTRSSCSTSRTTSWTFPASAGWKKPSTRPSRRSCSSPTTANSWRGTAKKIVTVEVGSSGGIGGSVWIHGSGFANYHEARKARFDRFEELLRRWEEEHRRLKDLVNTLRQQAKISPDMAAKYRAMCTRLEKFEQAGPPPAPPREQQVKMRLKGGRTGVRAFECVDLELSGLMKPFSTEDLLWRTRSGPWRERLREVPLPPSPRRRRGRRPHRNLQARRARRPRPLPPDAPPAGAGAEDAPGDPLGGVLLPARQRVPDARALCVERAGGTTLRQPLRRPAGALPDPAPGADRLHDAARWTSPPTTST